MGNERSFTLILRQAQDQSFTLIELLIVIGILAVLAIVAVLVLNPQELIKQARDTQRMADLTTLNKVLAVYQSLGQTNLGSATTVYVSVPANQTNCSDIGLPALPSGYTYACVTSSTLQKVDGTGWIPLVFSNVSYGTPLEKLPIDPINTTSTRNYYTYIPGGSWELATVMESAKYKMGGSADKSSSDGGSYPELYEEGTNLSLLPIDYGDSSLVGYWKFDEGSGGTAYDASGYNSTGTWYGTGTHYVAGRVGSCAGQFNGGDDYVNAGNNNAINPGTGDFSISLWVKPNGNQSTLGSMVDKYSGSGYFISLNGLIPRVFINDTGSYIFLNMGTTSVAANQWSYLSVVFYRQGNATAYINGSFVGNVAISTKSGSINIGRSLYIGHESVDNGWFNGILDDIRIYNRALSSAEIAAIYNATE